MEIQSIDIIPSSDRQSMKESEMIDSPMMGGESKYSDSLESRSDGPLTDISDDRHTNNVAFSVKSITMVPDGALPSVEEKQRSSRRSSKTVSKWDILSKNKTNLSSKSVRLLRSLVVEGTSPAPKKPRRSSSRTLLSSQQRTPSPESLRDNTDVTKKTVATDTNNKSSNDTTDDAPQAGMVVSTKRRLSKKDSLPSMSVLKSFFPDDVDEDDEGAELDYNDMSHEELVDAIESFRAVLGKERKKRTKSMIKLAKHLHKSQIERKELTEAHDKAMKEMTSVGNMDNESIIYQEKIPSKQQKTNDTEGLVDNAVGEVETQEAELASERQKSKDLDSKLAQGKGATEELTKEVDRLMNELDTSQKDFSSAELKHAQIVKELQSSSDLLCEKLLGSKAELATTHDSEARLREQLAETSKDNAILIQRMRDLSFAHDSQKEEVKDLHVRVEKLNSEREELVEESSNNISRLENEIALHQENISASEEKFQSATTRALCVEQELATLTLQLLSSQKSEDEHRNELLCQRTSSASLETEIKLVLAEIARTRTCISDPLNEGSDAEKETQEQDNLIAKLKHSKSHLISVQESVGGLRTKLNDATSENNNIVQDLHIRIEKLNSEREELVEESSNNISRLENEIALYQENILASEENFQSATTRALCVEQDLATLTLKLLSSQKSEDECRKELLCQRTSSTSLETEMKLVLAEIARTRTCISDPLNEASDAEKETKEQDNLIAKLKHSKSHLISVQDSVGRLRSELNDAISEKNNIMQAHSEASNNLSNQQIKVLQLTELLNTLETEKTSEEESESETIEGVEFEAEGSLEGVEIKWRHVSILPFVGWMPPVFWMFRSDLKHSCGPFVYPRQLLRWLGPMNESITPNEYRPFTPQNDP